MGLNVASHMFLRLLSAIDSNSSANSNNIALVDETVQYADLLLSSIPPLSIRDGPAFSPGQFSSARSSEYMYRSGGYHPC